MLSAWAIKMRGYIYLLLATACAVADKSDNRRNKLPFVVDAVGNALPPPSNVPATVGSPVNLLTPDRYEFYTFDESGELVKRLMTLEEIQAIVAAGEEAEGLVTIANENQPTVSFNIEQPPYTKVHSVVTNVQNVLKAQMEAHKNNPQLQPTLDTPDVSDSWSLILPSIFGNTGVDIILDKSSGAVTTPETVTLEEHAEEENSLSKEGDNQVLVTSTTKVDNEEIASEKASLIHSKENITKIMVPTTTISTTTITTSTTTTPKPTSAKPTTAKLTTTKPATAKTTTSKPVTFKSTIVHPTTDKSTTVKPTTAKYITTQPTTAKTAIITSTTVQPTTTRLPNTTKFAATTTRFFVTLAPKKPLPVSSKATTTVPQTKATTRPRLTTTTVKPTTPKFVIRTTAKVTSMQPEWTTKKQIINVSTVKETENDSIQIHPNSNTISSTEKSDTQFEKVSTFIPISTAKYVTERTTLEPANLTKSPINYSSTTKRAITTTTTTAPTTQTTKIQSPASDKPLPATIALQSGIDQEDGKFNATTITTQSVSPSTTMSSTEFLTADKMGLLNNVENKPSVNDGNIKNDNDPLLLFDVAQSFSQIASDLGSNFPPIPTTSNLLDTTKINELDLESKENVEMDIPSSIGNETDIKPSGVSDKNADNFIKISTINPHDKNSEEKPVHKIPIANTIVDRKTNEQESIDIKKNNVIIDTVQKIEFTSTQAATEPTTIDPILSESMGDLLSQVVNQAPSIVEAEEESEDGMQITTTEKNSAPMTTVISGTPNKVKENKISTTTTTTTEKNTFEKERNKTDDENKVTGKIESSEKKNDDSTKPADEVKTPTNYRNVTTESYETQFVQISGSSKINNSTVEQVSNDKNVSASGVKVATDSDTLVINNGSTTFEDMTDFETTINNLDMTETTTASNILSESNIDTKDKTNLMNKKDNLPEHEPKIDEFKKKIQKINIEEEELLNERNNSWKLVPTLSPPKVNEIPKDKLKYDNQSPESENKDVVLDFSFENQGLEVTTKDLGEDIARFSELFNELAFRYWNAIVDDIDRRRSFVFSPYSTFSMLAMIFMGAKGATSGEMNEILKLDDMVTFNPHFTLKNISDSIETSPQSGVAVSAFIRELYSDRNKGKILTFYKERAQHFYNGHVEEINFKLISDIIRRRTNLLVKRYSWGKIPEYMKTNNIVLQPPLAAFTANIFQTDCTGTSVDGRDGEMYFVVSPNVRQRRLIPVPAVVYKKGFLAGYDPVLDVTVAALGNTNTVVSTMFLMPGQQGNVVHADDLEKLEQRLLEASPTTPTWNRVLHTLLPRTGLEIQIPRFSHKSTFNASLTLKKMGLKDLFDVENADLGGLNGPSKDLYLSDMIQLNMFVTCGEGVVGEQHHIEEYPETLSVAQRRRARWLNDWDEPRDYQRAFHDPHDISDAMHLPLHLRPRQARLPARSTQPARLKFDRPFLYFVRHNPSGMILYFGRYNPRLLP